MALHHSPKIVTDGLSLCLDAANPKSYPGTGTTWFDISGNGIDSTPKNTPTWNAAGYFVFAATDGFEIASDVQATSIETSGVGMTYEIWFRSTTITGLATARIINRDPSDYWALTINQNAASPQTLGIYGEPTSQTYASTIDINVWYCVTVTHEISGNVIPYLNGIALASTNTYNGGTGSVTPIAMGVDTERTVGTNAGFTGDIAIYKMYNKILTVDEVEQNFNAHRARYGI